MKQPKPTLAPHHAPTPLSLYNARVQAGGLAADASQLKVLEHLEGLFHDIEGLSPLSKPSLLKRIFLHEKPTTSGIYIYGAVGRGKSMAMDLFFAALTQKSKRRAHFHAFMIDVHRRLHAFRQTDSDDVLPRVVEEIAKETSILCLDEFQVSDVTDAMILARLFTGLFEYGVRVVITSNRHPRDLYQGGLQRDQFLSFVALVEEKLDIISIDSPHDYRLVQLKAMDSTYVTPLDENADNFLVNTWNQMTHNESSRRLDIHVQGRTLRVEKHFSGIAWLTFDELCNRALGANDYIELAMVCHTLLLQNIPQMRKEDRNEAKRFVTLIDALYEYRVKLICTAAVMPDVLYPAGDGSFEFSRTVSRLIEMQSASYLALPHIE